MKILLELIKITKEYEKKRDRGEWSLAIAQGATGYYHYSQGTGTIDDINPNDDGYYQDEAWVGYIKYKCLDHETKIKPGTPGPEGVAAWAQVLDLTSKPPYIGENGNWFIYDLTLGIYVDSLVSASGGGAPGLTPRIGDNGYWYIGDTNLWVKAIGVNGRDGKEYEYIYTVTNQTPFNGGGLSYSSADEHIPSGWYDDPVGPSILNRFEWVRKGLKKYGQQVKSMHQILLLEQLNEENLVHQDYGLGEDKTVQEV